MTIAADYPFLDVLWTMLIFFAWVIWFWILIVVLSDAFRRHDLSGWSKAVDRLRDRPPVHRSPGLPHRPRRRPGTSQGP